jgi:c-di-AMP phosphodiesterase-like protein
MHEGEEQARQALEMALGRGGDQAAVRTASGYDFFGGRSRGVERRAKVRPRVIAQALTDLIHGNDMVFVMGHKFSDLDCLGSACALAVASRHMGKIAYVVVDRDKTLAPELLAHYEKAGFTDLFLSPQEALEIMGRRALVIVTDTHNPQLVESMALCEAANQTVVIDHHRRMASQIENAVIFYHEANASSASEMVAELVQYMSGSRLSAGDAEALLAGIMLDTRNFVMKAGARTFEAAAYLRSMGADTVSVKRLFSGSMEQYRLKSEIVSQAVVYRDMAIAVSGAGGPDIRVAAAQAADELLSISGVLAAFALFAEGDTVNISARSYGDVNVQLIAESLGGGGHHTMAGAQLRGVTPEQAVERLHESIDRYLKENA